MDYFYGNKIEVLKVFFKGEFFLFLDIDILILGDLIKVFFDFDVFSVL